MNYQAMLDALDDVVKDYGDGPEIDDSAQRLHMVQRGKHYSESEARHVVANVANDMRALAAKLDAIANM